mmetsp:Transcript_38590/g.97152  ORF Transcript_38590/g.97152 Transcript_38590/m.97152 type:complete len:397 (+) Transcript_38590:240-1430(+)
MAAENRRGLLPTFRVRIPETQFVAEPKPHTVYIIHIDQDQGGKSYQLCHRYSTINGLHNSLKEQYKKKVVMPRFPKKRFFSELDPAFIQQRQRDLERYLTELLKIEEILKSEEIDNFFHSADLVSYGATVDAASSSPTKVGAGASSASAHDTDQLISWSTEMMATLGMETKSSNTVHELAKRGELEPLQSILDADPSLLDSVNDENQTILHVAVGAEQVEVVHYLLRNSVEVNSQDYEGNTPLQVAATRARIDLIHLLERARGDPTIRTFFGETLFHICTKAFSDDTPEVEHMFERWAKVGAQLDAQDLKGNTALHYAAELGKEHIMSVFLRLGASVSVVNKENESALHFASRHSHQSCVKQLIEAGADVHLEGDHGTPLDLVMKKRKQRESLQLG